jgi:hypothetical protein
MSAFLIPKWLFFINIYNYKTISYSLKQEIIKIIGDTKKYTNSDRQFDIDLFYLCQKHVIEYERVDYDKSDVMIIYDFIYHLFFMDTNMKRRLDNEIRYWLNYNTTPTISFMFERLIKSPEEISS